VILSGVLILRSYQRGVPLELAYCAPVSDLATYIRSSQRATVFVHALSAHLASLLHPRKT